MTAALSEAPSKTPANRRHGSTTGRVGNGARHPGSAPTIKDGSLGLALRQAGDDGDVEKAATSIGWESSSDDGDSDGSVATDGQPRRKKFVATLPLQKFLLHGHADVVYRVRFTKDGSRMVTSSHDMTLRFWQLKPLGMLWC